MKSSYYYGLWVMAGAIVLAALMVIVLTVRPESVSAQVGARSRRQELIGQMRLRLSSAEAAERSAVLATTDQGSQGFAEQARAETTAIERLKAELGPLLQTDREKGLLAQFQGEFSDYLRIDGVLLDLAVRNTNLKAYALAYGPAAEAVRGVDASLSHLLKMQADAPDPDARQAMLLAAEADASILRTEILLPPHIAEESEPRMDELEALMRGEDRQFREDLAGLQALLPSDEDVRSAKTRYGQFTDLMARIIKLSRENTNVKSLTISLGEKRRISALCQDSLASLQEAVAGEVIPGEKVSIPR
jgi:hypothetical protein